MSLANNSIALTWAEFHLDLLHRSFPYFSPTMLARQLAIFSTSLYHVYAKWDRIAVTVIDDGIPRLSDSSPILTEEGFAEALSYASFRVIERTFFRAPNGSALVDLAKAKFTAMGYFVENGYEDTETAVGIGNQVASRLLEYFRADGANADGDEYGSATNASAFSDYTGYKSANDPQRTVGVTDCNAEIRDINHWQPLLLKGPGGTTTVQQFASPHTCMIKAFALKHNAEFRPRGPPRYGSKQHQQFVDEIQHVVNVSAILDDELKVKAEYWADGWQSTLPPGHWHHFALQLAAERQLGLAAIIQLLFAQSNAVFDAGIVAWDSKRFFDSVRPLTAVQCVLPAISGGQKTVISWKGPYLGVGEVDAARWAPYQQEFFVTPPFASYVSGHSAFSAASAEVFRLFFNGSDEFGFSATVEAGQSLFEPRISDPSDPKFVDGLTNVPNQGPGTVGYSPAQTIRLEWPTFTAAAAEAGMSRIYGGIHFASDNVDGLEAGRKVGANVWAKCRQLFDGVFVETDI